MELSREVAQIFDSQHAPPPPASIECKNKKKIFHWVRLAFKFACCCCETQSPRTLSGPPSTGAAIAMDGGVADTACYFRLLIGGGRWKE